jgi:hypothetical protein
MQCPSYLKMKRVLADSSNKLLLEDESDDDDEEDFLLNSKPSGLSTETTTSKVSGLSNGATPTVAAAAATAAATTAAQTKDWSSLKVAELKEELKKRGIKAAGKKADLVLLLKKQYSSDSNGKPYSPNSNELRVVTSGAITDKSVNAKIKHANRAELTKLLKKINKDYPKVGREIFENHHPDKEPIKPVRNDPLLQRCFRCPSKDADDLHDWYGLVVSYVHPRQSYSSLFDISVL